MRPARILLLVVALVAGGLAAFLATRGNAPQETKVVTEVKQESRSKVLVARESIGVGQRLDAEVLEWQDWPSGAVRPEYVSIDAVPDALQQLTGAVARFEFFPGEPIREAKLARASRGYLSAVIKPGYRGVSIAVSATSGAGGFIVPNDHVDVVLTRNSANGRRSETILSNVKVLAIGVRLGETGKTGATGSKQADEDPKSQNFTKNTIATLELDPLQSEAIINAAEVGSLALVLRSVTDFSESPDEANMQRKNASIKLIRFGRSTDVLSGSGDNAMSSDGQSEGASSAPAEVVYEPDNSELMLSNPNEPRDAGIDQPLMP